MSSLILIIASAEGLKSFPVRGLAKARTKTVGTVEKRLSKAMARFNKAARRMRELAEGINGEA